MMTVLQEKFKEAYVTGDTEGNGTRSAEKTQLIASTCRLTLKRIDFIRYLFMPEVGFNATEAYRRAYPNCKAGHNKLATRLMSYDVIKAEIIRKQTEIRKESVATRQQRQLFWTKVYFDKSNTMGDRLRASELLGKSEADFTEGIIDRTESVVEPLTEQETADLKRLAALSTIKMIESKVIDV